MRYAALRPLNVLFPLEQRFSTKDLCEDTADGPDIHCVVSRRDRCPVDIQTHWL